MVVLKDVKYIFYVLYDETKHILFDGKDEPQTVIHVFIPIWDSSESFHEGKDPDRWILKELEAPETTYYRLGNSNYICGSKQAYYTKEYGDKFPIPTSRKLTEIFRYTILNSEDRTVYNSSPRNIRFVMEDIKE